MQSYAKVIPSHNANAASAALYAASVSQKVSYRMSAPYACPSDLSAILLRCQHDAPLHACMPEHITVVQKTI